MSPRGRALEAELGTDVVRTDELPHLGVGHSLGCKVAPSPPR